MSASTPPPDPPPAAAVGFRVPSLPAPFCPPAEGPSSPSLALATLRHRWLLNNLPVLVQPRFDIANGNGFLAAFYDFPQADSSSCVLSLLFEGEASYEVERQHRLNAFGSFLYRSHNYRLYSRTADINHLAFHGCRLEGGWGSLHTTDFAGAQQWSRGAKRRRFLYFYSLMHHYDLELKAEAWRQWEDGDQAAVMQRLQAWRQQDAEAEQLQLTPEQRIAQLLSASPLASSEAAAASQARRPVVWLSTANHLMSPFDSNCSLPLSSLCFHSSYPVYAGSRETAERFARLCVRSKWTLFSFLPDFMSPVSSRDRKDRAAWQRLHHSAILNAHSTGTADTHHETAETATEAETEQQQQQLSVDGQVAAILAKPGGSE